MEKRRLQATLGATPEVVGGKGTAKQACEEVVVQACESEQQYLKKAVHTLLLVT